MTGTDGWSGRRSGLSITHPPLVPSWSCSGPGSCWLTPPASHGMTALRPNSSPCPFRTKGDNSFPVLLHYLLLHSWIFLSMILWTVLLVNHFHVKPSEGVMCFLPWIWLVAGVGVTGLRGPAGSERSARASMGHRKAVVQGKLQGSGKIWVCKFTVLTTANFFHQLLTAWV